ncbi:MAG: chitobiase/beta-hexosaminidase C-terminal domain-containing protein, partial [Bacteroidota bacterium]|nr:chitobiase/beta-hexosaminidase C-terminal domain-containing protein [Bacteroidota bacterium]
MSSNSTTIIDSFGNSSDWIEIYNDMNYDVNLNGYHLSDKRNDLYKWTFPSINIPAKSFLLIFASGKDIISGSELHTNFKIAKEGEPLYFCNTNGLIQDSTIAISLITDCSFGRLDNGGDEWFIYSEPTPGFSNSSSGIVISNKESGFYMQAFMLELFCPDTNKVVYYSLDGSDPTLSSLIYNKPILISTTANNPENISNIPTTPLSGPGRLNDYIWKYPNLRVKKAIVVKYRSFINDVAASKVYCKTFFVNYNSVNNNFPFVSIVTDSLNLFDNDSGIFIPGKYYDETGWDSWWPAGNYSLKGNEWERAVHFDFFTGNKELQIATNAGIRMHGCGSLTFPQKSFKLYF